MYACRQVYQSIRTAVDSSAAVSAMLISTQAKLSMQRVRTRGWPANTCVQGSRGVRMDPSQPQGNSLSKDDPHSQSCSRNLTACSDLHDCQRPRHAGNTMTAAVVFDMRCAHRVSSVA